MIRNKKVIERVQYCDKSEGGVIVNYDLLTLNVRDRDPVDPVDPVDPEDPTLATLCDSYKPYIYRRITVAILIRLGFKLLPFDKLSSKT